MINVKLTYFTTAELIEDHSRHTQPTISYGMLWLVSVQKR